MKNNFAAGEYRRLTSNMSILMQLIFNDGLGDWREINEAGTETSGRDRRRRQARRQQIFHEGESQRGDLHAQGRSAG